MSNETRAMYGDPPGDDPVERAGHVLKVYMDPNVGGNTNPSQVLVTATQNAYGQGVWTGLEWGDLQKLWALADQAQEALLLLNEFLAVMDDLKIPWTAPLVEDVDEFDYSYAENSARELDELGFVEIIPGEYSSFTVIPTAKGIFEALS